MRTQFLTTGVVDYLQTALAGYEGDFLVTDSTRLEPLALPLLAVAVSGAEAHSVALPGVLRCELEITLRCHSGDTESATMDDWRDSIESALIDASAVKAHDMAGVELHHWIYQGSTDDWDGEIVATSFRAECLMVYAPA